MAMNNQQKLDKNAIANMFRAAIYKGAPAATASKSEQELATAIASAPGSTPGSAPGSASGLAPANSASSAAQKALGWSPNNLRRIVLSPTGVILQWFTTSGTPLKSTISTLMMNSGEAVAYSLGNAPHDYFKQIAGPSARHQFSNVEEIIILANAPTWKGYSGLSFDAEQLVSSINVSKLPRLAAVAVATEEVDINDFFKEYGRYFNAKSTDLVCSKLDTVRFSVKELNKEWFRAKALRSGIYDIDGTSLRKVLNEIQEAHNKLIDEAMANSVDVASMTFEDLHSLEERNAELVKPIDEYLALLKTATIVSATLNYPMMPKVPTGNKVYIADGGNAEDPVFKNQDLLEQLSLITATPLSNQKFLEELYACIKSWAEDLFKALGLHSSLYPTGDARSYAKSLFDVLFNSVLVKNPLNTPDGYEVLPEERYLQLLHDASQVIDNCSPQEVSSVINNFLVKEKLSGLVYNKDSSALNEYLTTLDQTRCEYIAYNILLNLQDKYKGEPLHLVANYSSIDNDGLTLLLTSAVPSKHLSIRGQEQALTLNDRYVKRLDYFVNYRVAAPGTKVHNFLEDTDYTTDAEHNIILTDTVGEEWVCTEAKLRKSYIIDDNLALNIGDSGKVSPRPDDNIIFAKRALEQTIVNTSWGTALTAHPGDMIAYASNGEEPNLEDSWVINKDIFKTTYEKYPRQSKSPEMPEVPVITPPEDNIEATPAIEAEPQVTSIEESPFSSPTVDLDLELTNDPMAIPNFVEDSVIPDTTEHLDDPMAIPVVEEDVFTDTNTSESLIEEQEAVEDQDGFKLSPERQAIIDDFRNRVTRKVWQNSAVTDELIEQFLTTASLTDDIITLQRAMYDILQVIINQSKRAGILLYLAKTYNLQGAIKAATAIAGESIAVNTLRIMETNGREDSWEAIVNTMKILLKYRDGEKPGSGMPLLKAK